MLPVSALGRVVPSRPRRAWPGPGASGLLVRMIGATAPLGLSAAAAEQLRAAQHEVGRLLAEVDDVATRLRRTGEIPWSGVAAGAWRDRLEAARHGVVAGGLELEELQVLLAGLHERLRA